MAVNGQSDHQLLKAGFHGISSRLLVSDEDEMYVAMKASMQDEILS